MRLLPPVHTLAGKSLGLSEEELQDARKATSSDPKTEAILKLAQAVVREKGRVPDAAVEVARHAGLDDGAIAEVVANVALKVFTNYFNHVAQTEVDFPLVRAQTA